MTMAILWDGAANRCERGDQSEIVLFDKQPEERDMGRQKRNAFVACSFWGRVVVYSNSQIGYFCIFQSSAPLNVCAGNG